MFVLYINYCIYRTFGARETVKPPYVCIECIIMYTHNKISMKITVNFIYLWSIYSLLNFQFKS